MGLFDQLSPKLYSLVKRNRQLRNAVMPLWQLMARAFVKGRSILNRDVELPAPTGICTSTEQWVQSALARDPAARHSFQLLHPATEIRRALPKTIEKTVHWRFRAGEVTTQPATFVATIEQGRAYNEGAVITPDDQLLADVSWMIVAGEYSKDASDHAVFKNRRLPPLHKVDGRVAVLSATSGRGYYHWMFDVLPRLHLLREAGISLDSIDRFLVNNYVSRFHIETLSILGIPRGKIMESHWNPHVKADQLIVPSLVGDTGYVPVYACEFLRDTFLPKVPIDGAARPKRLYFNRTQVTHRRVTNETEVIDLLGRHGFESITLENLPLTEQIALLAGAEVVVVPHGAGLTNIVFCKPGTKIIELLSPNAVNVMYWTISNQVGLDYYYVLSDGARAPEFVNPYNNNDDLRISLTDLSDVLEMAGLDRQSTAIVGQTLRGSA
ncbi:MAG TPA: glycosyltransferase family 61 protein [Tepidisphaeraceae bacterium]|jgi:capsular polysaccharide biosynthesis protein|nr:glycosyltransferase family 61 protein [Tepidisphaeraceae bacterium]